MYETDDLKMISYDFGHQYILPHAAKCFHNSLDFHRILFDYEPSEKVNVLIQDFGDYGNAGATAIPYNFITMGLSPFSYAFETSPAGERVYSMMHHELVHVVALDGRTKSDKRYQKLFSGKVNPTKDNPISVLYSYMTNPRMYAPRWYHEGIAAYVETWMNGGIGLALGSYDEMIFRTRVLEDSHIYSAQGLESEGVTSDFQGRSNSYLYGTRFMGYLSYTYGPDKIIDWVKRTDGSKAFFAGQFKQVFGVPIDQGWDDWIAFEREWQHSNIDRIQQNPITEGVPISHETLGSISYAHYDKSRDKIYVAINHPGQFPHLAAIDMTSGQVDNLTDIKGPALFYVSSVIYDEDGDRLFFTSDNNAWRDLMQYDLKTGQTSMLQKDFRTGDLAFNKKDKSIWGIKHLNGYSTIVKVDKGTESTDPYSTWEQKHTLPYGEDIFDIDISPDGKILSAAVSDLNANQSLLLYDLEALESGDVVIDTIFNFEVSSPQGFRFSEDGKYLHGTSYYSGVSNIFRVEVETKGIKVMSNALTGLFRPVVLNDEELLAFEFKSDGFTPVKLKNEPVSNVSSIDFLGNIAVEKHGLLKDWELPLASTNSVDLDNLNLTESTYIPGKELKLNYAYPIVVGYKDRFGFGYKFNMSDPIHFREFNFDISYTPNAWNNSISSFDSELSTDLETDELFHFSLSARFKELTFHAGYNEADFYDLFGPVNRSKRGVALGANWEHSLIWDLPKKLDLSLGINGFYGLERSPDFQQINSTEFDDQFFLRVNSSLNYSHLKKSLGGVESEKGFSTGIGLSLAQSGSSIFPTLTSSLDYGFQLPLNHSSIWLRSVAGHSFNSEFNPFTRFAFAGFGNNFVDHRAHKSFRNDFSFAGVSFTNDFRIISKSYFRGMAEWVLPPIRFRKFGGFNFFANWTQFSLFSSFLSTSDPDFGSNQFYNLGAQMDTRLVMFSHLPATFSLGYARAWDIGASNSHGEFLISLNLLH